MTIILPHKKKKSNNSNFSLSKQKIKVTKILVSDLDLNLQGNVDDLPKNVKSVIQTFKNAHPEYSKLWIEQIYWPLGVSFDLWGEREETDREFKNRMKYEK